jgi:hypothetical protein
MGDWPTNAAAVSAEWLDAVLRRGGSLSNGKINAVSAADLGTGVGLMGEVSRLSIGYDKAAEGAPTTIIGKFPTSDPVNLHVARLLCFYSREVAFYTRLAQASPIRTPRLFHAELDMSDHSFVLLLEDLRGAVPGDQVAGLAPDQAETAIKAIGRVHAAWWGKVDAAGMEGLFDFGNPEYGAAVQSAYQRFLAPALDNFGDCYSDYTKKVAEGLGVAAARVIREQASSQRTLVHGDYRADNLLFGPSLGADGMAAVDWQVSGRGGALYDVAYVISTSVPTAYRRQHEKALLGLYHDTLLAAGVKGFSVEECWEAYRLAVLCALFVAIFSAGGIDLGNHRGHEMVRTAARRIDNAVADLQAGDFLPA